MLASGHDDYQFRYFEKSFNMATLPWIREGVSNLAQAVEMAVDKERHEREKEAKAKDQHIVSIVNKIVISSDKPTAKK